MTNWKTTIIGLVTAALSLLSYFGIVLPTGSENLITFIGFVLAFFFAKAGDIGIGDIKANISLALTGLISLLSYFGIVIPANWLQGILGLGTIITTFFMKDAAIQPINIKGPQGHDVGLN